MTFVVKDSGERIEYDSGMVRDTQEGKTNYLLIRRGPMHDRWADHMTKGAEKYGEDNWTLACSEAELSRFRSSAARHFEQWLRGDRDEDHGAAVFFNINAVEYTQERIAAEHERFSGAAIFDKDPGGMWYRMYGGDDK